MAISLKRAYHSANPDDGYRVLVDRLWPRGVSKDEAKIDDWMKEIAPSEDLRKGLHHGSMSWEDFRNSYLSELKEHRETLRDLAERSKEGKITLVYSAKDEEHNNAVVLEQYLRMLGGE